MQKRETFLVFLVVFIIFTTILLNFSIKKSGGKLISPYYVKRGYIFDRNLNPLVVTSENYKAYYVIKGNFIINSQDLSIIRKYLGNALDLPKKGIILLSEELSLDEIETLKKDKNVIIEKNFKRKTFYPYLKDVIGEVAYNEGISGLEKIFNNSLKCGNPLILSLDLNLEKKIYNTIQEFKIINYGIAVFNIETGEVLGYLENKDTKIFESYFPLNLFGIPEKEIKSFDWTLGNNPVIIEGNIKKINMWHLAKWYMEKMCNHDISPTLIYTKFPKCNFSLEVSEKNKTKYVYNLNNDTFITITFKKNKLLLSSLQVPSLELNQYIVNKLISFL